MVTFSAMSRRRDWRVSGFLDGLGTPRPSNPHAIPHLANDFKPLGEDKARITEDSSLRVLFDETSRSAFARKSRRIFRRSVSDVLQECLKFHLCRWGFVSKSVFPECSELGCVRRCLWNRLRWRWTLASRWPAPIPSNRKQHGGRQRRRAPRARGWRRVRRSARTVPCPRHQ